MTELLYQIFLVILSAVGVFVIVTLIQVIGILVDVKHTTTIASNRVAQVDGYIGKAIESLKDTRDLVKGLLLSIDFVKNLRDKFTEKQK